MRNKELKSLNEAISKVLNPQDEQLEEAKAYAGFIEDDLPWNFNNKWKRISFKDKKDLEKQVSAAIKKGDESRDLDTNVSIDDYQWDEIIKHKTPYIWINHAHLELYQSVEVEASANKRSAESDSQRAAMEV